MSETNETSSERGVDWVAWSMLAVVMVSFGSTFVFNNIALTEISALSLGAGQHVVDRYALLSPLPSSARNETS